MSSSSAFTYSARNAIITQVPTKMTSANWLDRNVQIGFSFSNPAANASNKTVYYNVHVLRIGDHINATHTNTGRVNINNRLRLAMPMMRVSSYLNESKKDEAVLKPHTLRVSYLQEKTLPDGNISFGDAESLTNLITLKEWVTNKLFEYIKEIICCTTVGKNLYDRTEPEDIRNIIGGIEKTSDAMYTFVMKDMPLSRVDADDPNKFSARFLFARNSDGTSEATPASLYRLITGIIAKDNFAVWNTNKARFHRNANYARYKAPANKMRENLDIKNMSHYDVMRDLQMDLQSFHEIEGPNMFDSEQADSMLQNFTIDQIDACVPEIGFTRGHGKAITDGMRKNFTTVGYPSTFANFEHQRVKFAHTLFYTNPGSSFIATVVFEFNGTITGKVINAKECPIALIVHQVIPYSGGKSNGANYLNDIDEIDSEYGVGVHQAGVDGLNDF